MAKYHRPIDNKQKQKRPLRVKPAPVAPMRVQPEGGQQMGAIDPLAAETAPAQAAQLGDSRLQTAQRQALAVQIGQRQGNQHLQRLVALHQAKEQAAGQPPGGLIQRRDPQDAGAPPAGAPAAADPARPTFSQPEFSQTGEQFDSTYTPVGPAPQVGNLDINLWVHITFAPFTAK